MPRKKPKTRRQQPPRSKRDAVPRKKTQRRGDLRRPPLQSTAAADLGGESSLLPLSLQDSTTVGFLLMDVAALEGVLAKHMGPLKLDEPEAVAGASLLSGPMLRGLAAHVARYLDMEVRLFPAALGVGRFVDDPKLRTKFLNSFISSLKELVSDLERDAPAVLAELPSFPSVIYLQRLIVTHGLRSQRDALKRILATAARGTRGRPTGELEDRQDVRLARQVEEAKRRLKNGFAYVRAQKKAGGHKNGDEKLSPKLAEMKMKYNQTERERSYLESLLWLPPHTLPCCRESRRCALEPGTPDNGCRRCAWESPPR